MASGDLIPRVYGGFRGVDFRGEEINLARSPDSLNVWRNYKKTEGIETRPGMKLLSSFTDAIYGIFFYQDMMIVHSGTNLYKEVNGERTTLYEGVNAVKSDAFIYNNLWFFKDGANYLQYDGDTIGDVQGYIPTTSIARKPVSERNFASGGTIKEDVNLLSDYRINTFIGDGVNERFYLDVPTFDGKQDDKFKVEINGENIYTDDSDYEVYLDPIYGMVRISPAPPAPLTDGQDNVKITFKKTIDKSKITKCTLLQIFDNRVFFSGNPDYPNMMWHCSLNDPTYCSDLDYYNEGLDTAKVKGMVAGNNALWVFKEPSQANTTIFYHTPTIDVEYGKIYPNAHSSITTGCVGRAINFNDDIIFFSDRGMEGISGDITSEQVIAHRSSLIDRKLTAETTYKDMFLEEWEGYLLVFCLCKLDKKIPGTNIPLIGTRVYLADSRAMFTNENHAEYEWFCWEFDKPITCSKVNKGILYLGTNDGVYTLTDTTCAVKSWWVTPKDKFKHPQYLKTTNKRGCVIEATGDITVSVKTEKTDFEDIGTYTGISDYFVSRIKRKKFKDIQLKFYSNTRFSLETATLECFIGGYTKR